MLKSNKKQHLITGLITTFTSFILIFVGVRFVLGNEINAKNIVAFVGFSIIVGMVTSLLMFLKLKIAYTSFMVGLAFGFLLMYKAFWSDMSGWGDLIGLISMFMWAIIGLGVGLLVQLGYYLFKKYRKM